MTPDRETLAAAVGPVLDYHLRDHGQPDTCADCTTAMGLAYVAVDAILPLLAPPPSEGEAGEAAGRRTWPYTTPSGHVYAVPDTYEALRERHTDAAQAEIESWDAAERPPEPTWELLGVAHERVAALLADRDRWRARAFRAARLAMEPEGP